MRIHTISDPITQLVLIFFNNWIKDKDVIILKRRINSLDRSGWW